jgi:CheY-like chemotaxis protein
MTTPSKHQILVVDDDSSVREIFANLLVSIGYDVQVAEDGLGALLQLRKVLPDAIISDLNMPRMSGFEFLSIVRRRFPKILTVAMSGAYRGSQLPRGVIADAFYAKGEPPGNLYRTLEQLLCTAAARGSNHHRELSPAWIPRNGNDSRGVPYVVVACAECLRTFQLTVAEETAGDVVEIPCYFCPSINKYIIEPSIPVMRDLCA